MAFGIQHIAHYLPEARINNATLVERCGFDAAFLEQKLGILERRLADGNETVAYMGAKAAEANLIEHGVDKGDIDALIVVTQTPDYCLPHSSALVHEALDLHTDVPVFDISLGCSGFVYGLSVMSSFLESIGGSTGLLITADTYSNVIDPKDRATAPLFGDGACATLLSRDGVYELGKFTFGSDGRRHKALIVPESGTRRGGGPKRLHMDGRAIFSFMMSEIPADVERCLALNDVTKDDIDLWVFHQASQYMLESLARQVDIPIEKVIIDMADIGNTTSSTIPISLERQVLSRSPLPRRVYISGFGVGLSWASTILSLQGT